MSLFIDWTEKSFLLVCSAGSVSWAFQEIGWDQRSNLFCGNCWLVLENGDSGGTWKFFSDYPAGHLEVILLQMLRAAAIVCWSWRFLMLSGCVTKRKKKKFYLLTHGPLTRETISEEFRFCRTPVANLNTHRWVVTQSLGHEYEYTRVFTWWTVWPKAYQFKNEWASHQSNRPR